jgi:hypothetical protein
MDRIDLHLPTSWNACTTKELEAIVVSQMLVPLDPPKEKEKKPAKVNKDDGVKEMRNITWKVDCLLRLAGLEMVEGPTPEVAVEEQYIMVQRANVKRSWWSWLPWVKTTENEPFALYIWQIHYWIDKYMSWLDKPPYIPTFPYPVWKCKGKEFHGPKTWLSDWKWAQYRMMQDYLQYYFEITNIISKKLPKANDEERKKLEQQLRTAKALVLATVYCRRVKVVDEETHVKKRDWVYLANQSSENNRYFQDYPDVQFQVVLLWWGSQMERLHNIYPKCFKTSEKAKAKRRVPDPLELYAQLTATLEKYTGFDEKTIDKESHEVVLRNLSRLIEENEEIEKMRSKH